MKRSTSFFATLLVSLACQPGDEAADRDASRSAVQEALQRSDRAAALEALEPLRANADTPEELIELTTLMLHAGEAAQAVWILDEALSRFPDRSDLRLQLARMALLVQDPSRARRAVEPIGARSDKHLEALLLRARAELELGDSEAALATYAEAMALYPDRPESALARVQTLAQEGRIDEARAAVGEALANSDLPEASRRNFEVVAAEFEARAGEIDAAIGRLRARVDDDPTEPLMWHALLNLMLRAEQSDAALSMLEAARERDPESTMLLGLLADVYRISGRTEAAEAAHQQLIALSDTPSHRLALARLRHRNGDFAGAADALADALVAHPDEPMLEMHRAESNVDAGNLVAARAAATAFRAQRADDPHVQYLQARIELADGRADAAAQRLKRVVSKLDASYTQFWLGRALEATGDLQGAERRYGLAMIRDPNDAAAPASLLRIAHIRGDWRGVISAARSLVQRAPREPEGYRMLAAALLRLDEGQAAEVAAKELAEIVPEGSEPVLLRARALRVQSRPAEAQAVLDEALARLGPRADLEAERAFGWALEGRVDEAVATVKTLAVEHPDTIEVQRTLAMLAFALGDTETGSQATDRAFALAPEDPAPLATRARYAASRGLWEQARDDLIRAQALRPADAEFAFLRGAVEAGAGDAHAAEQAYRSAAELDATHFAARNNLALIVAERGDLEAALVFAQQAHAIDAENADGLDTLGWLYLQSGLVDRSIAFLERAHAADPDQAEARQHLALAYRKAGRDADADALARSTE